MAAGEFMFSPQSIFALYTNTQDMWKLKKGLKWFMALTHVSPRDLRVLSPRADNSSKRCS